jgi:outer membrane protein
MKDINMKKFLTALTLTALTSTVVNAAGYGGGS